MSLLNVSEEDIASISRAAMRMSLHAAAKRIDTALFNIHRGMDCIRGADDALLLERVNNARMQLYSALHILMDIVQGDTPREPL